MAAVASMLVTLTTDLGTADGYVGAMKGVLQRTAPGLTVIDIAHDVPRHDIAAGAHALATAAPWFPAGTVHVGVVDPGVGGRRRGVVVVTHDQLFVGPDNGLFSLVAPEPAAAFEIAAREFRAERVSPTFHGRDLFAVAAARLAAGAAPEQVGPPVALVGRLPGAGSGGASGPDACGVVHVDTFGNLITDIPADSIPAGSRVRVAGHDVGPVRRTFEDVAHGELLAYVGSRGTLAIAVREGSAAERLGAGRGAPVEIVPP